MKQKKSLVMFGIGILILSLLAVPRAMVWAQKAQEKPIRLGVLVDFTGPMAFSGQPVLDGVKMRLEEANYKVAGRTIELVVEDAATDASIALEKAKKWLKGTMYLSSSAQ